MRQFGLMVVACIVAATMLGAAFGAGYLLRERTLLPIPVVETRSRLVELTGWKIDELAGLVAEGWRIEAVYTRRMGDYDVPMYYLVYP